jgi:hypothetical protein
MQVIIFLVRRLIGSSSWINYYAVLQPIVIPEFSGAITMLRSCHGELGINVDQDDAPIPRAFEPHRYGALPNAECRCNFGLGFSPSESFRVVPSSQLCKVFRVVEIDRIHFVFYGFVRYRHIFFWALIAT